MHLSVSWNWKKPWSTSLYKSGGCFTEQFRRLFFESVLIMLFNDTWFQEGCSVSHVAVLFGMLANHRVRHQATHKVDCQPGDCRWSLYHLWGLFFSHMIWIGLCCLMTPVRSKDIWCHVWPCFCQLANQIRHQATQSGLSDWWLYMVTLFFLRDLCGYVWVKMLTLSPPRVHDLEIVP